jgi:hypothetical protein
MEKETGNRLEIEKPRQDARTARTNLETSLERLTAEPGVTIEQISRINTVLASSHRFAHAIMALEAGLPLSPTVPPREEFRMFVADVEKTVSLLEEILAGEKVVERKFPNLREDHNRLIAAGNPEKQRYGLVNIEADRITNSLNTLREEIVAWIRLVRAQSDAGPISLLGGIGKKRA